MVKEYIVKKKVGKDGRVFATKEVGEIVRCKDCKYWNDWQAHTYCGRFDEYDFMPSDGYCSYGRRKEQEHE